MVNPRFANAVASLHVDSTSLHFVVIQTSTGFRAISRITCGERLQDCTVGILHAEMVLGGAEGMDGGVVTGPLLVQYPGELVEEFPAADLALAAGLEALELGVHVPRQGLLHGGRQAIEPGPFGVEPVDAERIGDSAPCVDQQGLVQAAGWRRLEGVGGGGGSGLRGGRARRVQHAGRGGGAARDAVEVAWVVVRGGREGH